MNIPRRVQNLVKKYRTRNPYELASCLNIHVISRPMHDSVHGFFDRVLKQKFIVINSKLPEHLQRQTCAHEIGHALLHKGWGYYFMVEHTFFAPGRFEREANEFAWLLLYNEEECAYDCCGDINRYVCETGIAELLPYASLMHSPNIYR